MKGKLFYKKSINKQLVTQALTWLKLTNVIEWRLYTTA